MTSTFSLTSVSHGFFFFFFQAEDGIRDIGVTGVQTCALPISEEWRSAAEERAFEEENQAAAGRSAGPTRERWSEARWTASSPRYTPRQYPPHVLAAYHRLGLGAGSSLDEANRKRRELVKRYHPDRFVEPGQRARAERLTAEINAAHDIIERHLLRR